MRHRLGVSKFDVAVIVARLGFILAALACFQYLTTNGTIPFYVMPSPTEMASGVWSTLGTAQLWQDVGATSMQLAAALAIAIPSGMLVGVLCWRLPFAGAVFLPLIATLYAVPVIVFYPILLVWFGLGSWPIIAIAAIVSMIPVALNTAMALRSVQPTLVKLALSLNCTSWQRYRKVLLPGAALLVIAGVELSIIFGLLTVVATEFLVATDGLGFRIDELYQGLQVDDMWSFIVIVLGYATVILAIVRLATRRIKRALT
jgi:NitT/TauT family transport system permease protein